MRKFPVSGALDTAILLVPAGVIGFVMVVTMLTACSAPLNKQIARGLVELAPDACLLLDPGHPEVCTYLEDLKALEPLLAARRAGRANRDGGAADAPADVQ